MNVEYFAESWHETWPYYFEMTNQKQTNSNKKY